MFTPRTLYVLHVKSIVSCITCHVSLVMYHLSCVTGGGKEGGVTKSSFHEGFMDVQK